MRKSGIRMEPALCIPETQLNLWYGQVRRVLCEEVNELHPRLLLAQALLHMLPLHTGNRLRSQILRSIGFKIGHGTLFLGNICITGSDNIYSHLVIGMYSMINIRCVFDLEEQITIGDRVGIGHDVLILTSTHHVGSEKQRTGELLMEPVTIGDGAWIGARASVLPGVTIGTGAVISAGSVVTRNVPPNTMFAGSPARLVKRLDS